LLFLALFKTTTIAEEATTITNNIRVLNNKNMNIACKMKGRTNNNKYNKKINKNIDKIMIIIIG
jgi:hypothetical protein